MTTADTPDAGFGDVSVVVLIHAMPLGMQNWPVRVPMLPHAARNFPSAENRWTSRWSLVLTVAKIFPSGQRQDPRRCSRPCSAARTKRTRISPPADRCPAASLWRISGCRPGRCSRHRDSRHDQGNGLGQRELGFQFVDEEIRISRRPRRGLRDFRCTCEFSHISQPLPWCVHLLPALPRPTHRGHELRRLGQVLVEPLQDAPTAPLAPVARRGEVAEQVAARVRPGRQNTADRSAPIRG